MIRTSSNPCCNPLGSTDACLYPFPNDFFTVADATTDTGRRVNLPLTSTPRNAANVPIETLLLETDAPDQPDSTHRGERNEPARITRVLEVIAGLRGVDAEVIADATSRNAERLFALPSIA